MRERYIRCGYASGYQLFDSSPEKVKLVSEKRTVHSQLQSLVSQELSASIIPGIRQV